MAQLVCGGCHTLLMYIRGATGVQCSCCRTFNLALEGSANVRVGLAHQQVPFNVPHCIARFLKEWNVGPKRTVQDQRSRGSWAAKSNIWGDSDSNKNPEEKDTHGVWNQTSYNTNSDVWGGQDSKDAAGGNTNSDVWGSQNRKEFHAKRSVEIGGMSAKSDVWGSQVSKEANIEKSSDTGGWNANIMPDQLNQQPKATGWGSTRSPGFSWISDQCK